MAQSALFGRNRANRQANGKQFAWLGWPLLRCFVAVDQKAILSIGLVASILANDGVSKETGKDRWPPRNEREARFVDPARRRLERSFPISLSVRPPNES